VEENDALRPMLSPEMTAVAVIPRVNGLEKSWFVVAVTDTLFTDIPLNEYVEVEDALNDHDGESDGLYVRLPVEEMVFDAKYNVPVKEPVSVVSVDEYCIVPERASGTAAPAAETMLICSFG
jgi:hypothetical protein